MNAASKSRSTGPWRPRRPGRAPTCWPALLGLLLLGCRQEFEQQTPSPPPPTLQRTPATGQAIPATQSQPPAAKNAGWVVASLEGPSFDPALRNPLTQRGPLAHEIIRQAVLLAARDEARRPTRDTVLRESTPPAEKSPTLVLGLKIQTGGEPSLAIFRQFPNRVQMLHNDRVAPLVSPLGERVWEMNWLRLLAGMEQASRTTFVDVLKEADFEIGGVRKSAAGEVPEQISRQLQSMDPFSQFAALRSLHALVGAEGESSERIAAIARGYAQLGALVAPNPGFAHKVFKARAMLYAERLLAAQPQQPQGYWQRAFVLALAGFHALALEDLSQAELLSGRSKEEDALSRKPIFVDAIDAFCRFDGERLASEARERESLAPLVALLQTIAVRPTSVSDAVAIADRLLAAAPHCDAALDLLFRTNSLGAMHRAVRLGPQVLAEGLDERLAQLPGLPETARGIAPAALPEPSEDEAEAAEQRDVAFAAACVALVQSLRRAADDDVGEPSWGVLATIVEDANLAHAWRWKVLNSSGCDCTPTKPSPWLGEHPLRWSFEKDLATAELDIARAADGDLTYQEFARLIQAMRMDPHKMRQFDPRGLPRRFLGRGVSPHAPATVQAVITEDWSSAEPHAAEWEKKYSRDPEILYALAVRYEQAGRPEAAARCLEQCVELNPDRANCEALADLRSRQGDWDGWRQALEHYLQCEAFELDHARVGVRLAERFMALRQWRRAAPYAEQAANSSAGWAMLTAARCYEALGEWEPAEKWFREAALRREDGRLRWYFFCKRTGRGDLAKARELAADHLDQITPGSASDLRAFAGIFHFLEGDLRQALEFLRRDFLKDLNPFVGLLAAVAADELHEDETRDGLLRIVEAQGATFIVPKTCRPRRELVYLAGALARDLAAGGRGELPLSDLDALLSRADKSEGVNGRFFLGLYLNNHGHRDTAIEYWKTCMSDPGIIGVARTIAGYYLLQDGIGPESYRQAFANPRSEPAAP